MIHKRIVTFCNRGIEELVAGYDDDAINQFRGSLALLKSVMHPSPNMVSDIVDDQERTTTTSAQQRISFSVPLACATQEISRNQTYHRGRLYDISEYYSPYPAKLEGLQQDSFAFIYSRPFVFVGNLSPRDLGCFLPLHSAVVIFNMALAHHRQGKATRRRKLLEKAIMLYNMCLQILNHGEWQQGIAVLVDAAAMNNVAQLHFEIGNQREAQNGVDQLSVLLFALNCVEVLASIDKEALEGFLLNIILLKPPVVAVAA